MEKYFINKETLTGIADAVRQHSDSSELIAVKDLAQKVNDLPVIKNGITWDAFNEEGWVTEATLYTTENKIPDDAFACTKDNYGYYGVYSHLNTLNLPSNITHVGAYAFQDCIGITTFNFDNIETMGNGAFKGCTNLTISEFPKKITRVGKYTFEGCNATFTTLPENLTCDGYAFYKIPGLTTLTVPSNWETIPTYCFYGCQNLHTINLSDSITSIDTWAFSECKALKTIQWPSNLKTIGAYCFYGCAFSELVLPASLETLGAQSFRNCTSLSGNLEIPASVTSIGGYVFEKTNLSSITFKGTPTSIASSVFNSCNNLTTINVPWAEGAVANAPWGATKATINYNYVAPAEEE